MHLYYEKEKGCEYIYYKYRFINLLMEKLFVLLQHISYNCYLGFVRALIRYL